ncbi:NAD(P)-dependent oxidoreductase [Vibrio ostreae]|uniref:NAD(P)-dependent oxidoreductase n=1 Tax=Vibrio ostreae TaxID=2841925 RepID=A0A975U5U0_9VIBR|nr:NAD(P)-dependent oxidoreductase [Vibrio ostreae]QXO15715.1 NAD(P)-dependent oxidoreductase [Vibrio ostreae]
MKVAVFGATGWIGSHIVEEVKAHGHDVVAIARDPSKVTAEGVEVRQFDLSGDAKLASVLVGVDAVIASIGGRAAGNHEIVANTAKNMLEQLPAAGIERLLWVGGAGSLEVAPGIQLFTVPDFPAEYKSESLAQGDALQVFKNSDSAVQWTFICPAAEIFPGDKQGAYRVTVDQFMTDAEGNSRISVADYAAALVDELDSGDHPRQRIGFAY